MMTKVRRTSCWEVGVLTVVQAFKARVVELVDQAQHFAAIGAGGSGGSAGETAKSFREGLDASERESGCIVNVL